MMTTKKILSGDGRAKRRKALRFDILSIFPKAFDSYFSESLIKRGKENKIIDIRAHDLREWSLSRHKKVDDKPFGGGPGMVMQIEPIYRAVRDLERKRSGSAARKTRVILFSTRGKKFDSATAKRLAKYDQLILICGRYEGVDERVAEHIADEEISMGDYVLSGGELPAMILVEAVSRYLPGFLGKYESLEDDRGSFPAYTRPEVFIPGPRKATTSLRGQARAVKQRAWLIPKVLSEGNHAKIEEWRKQRSRPSSSPER